MAQAETDDVLPTRDRTADGDVHYEACDGLRCPCYVQGQVDLAEALRVAQRMGVPIDGIIGTGAGDGGS